MASTPKNKKSSSKKTLILSLTKLNSLKKGMSSDQKQKVLELLRKLRSEEVTGNIGGETDIANADNLVSEEGNDDVSNEKNVIAKTFDTKADFDSYVNQRRGIEMTGKEQQAIFGYKNAKPTQQDKFFVKYESTDDFGNNDTTVIKKLKEGNQYCWTGFSKHETAEQEGNPKEQPSQPGQPQKKEVTVNDSIRITKTSTFINDDDGAEILSDFLIKLDV